jgi:hypothetical protein
VFISYRRDDTAALVGALDRRLRQDLGSRNVFRDVHDLIAGERFEVRLTDEIERSDIVLVVIGPRWEGAGDGTGGSRLAREDDFVRLEVRTALEHRPRTTPMPVLIDGATFPPALPADIDAITEHHAVTIDHDELDRREAPGYQALLVGTWVAKSRAVPNGVILLGDDSPKAKARLDALVEEMRKADLIDVSQITRYACGAQVLSMRKARRLARKYPDVIVAIDDDSADSPVLAARVQALRDHRLRKIALLAIGGGITYGAGVAAGTGALSNLSPQLASDLVALGKPSVVTKPAKLWSWQATTSAKLAAGAVAAGTLAVTAVAVWPEGEPAPHELAGTWTIDDWQIVERRIVPADFDAELEPEQLVITPNPEDCRGDACSLEAVRTLAGGPTDSFMLEPTADGWRGELDETWTCTDDAREVVVVEIASEGRAVYTVRPVPDADELAVTYTFEGSPTDEGARDCPGDPLEAIEIAGTATTDG